MKKVQFAKKHKNSCVFPYFQGFSLISQKQCPTAKTDSRFGFYIKKIYNIEEKRERVLFICP